MDTCRINIQTVRRKVLKIALVSSLLSAAVAHGFDLSPSQTRISSAGDKFDGVTQFAVAVDVPASGKLRAHHVEVAFGAITATGDSEMFVSYGPVWRLPVFESDYFVDLGFAPTLVSGTRFGGRDLGGHLHFTSSISVGRKLDDAHVALRVQHLSNGGLSGTNPGMDMIGLEFSIGFAD